MPFLSVLSMVGTLSESKFLHANRGSTLKTGLSEASSLKSAMLSLLWMFDYFSHFNFWPFGGYVVVSHVFTFPWWVMVLNTFSLLYFIYCPFGYLLGKVLIQNLSLFFKSWVFFVLFCFVSSYVLYEFLARYMYYR